MRALATPLGNRPALAIVGKRPTLPQAGDLPRLPADAPPPASLDEAAKVEWSRLCRELDGRLGMVDGDLLECYCRVLCGWRSAQAEVDSLGLVCRSPSGLPCPNPYLAVAAGLLRQLVALSDRLGLSPASRKEPK